MNNGRLNEIIDNYIEQFPMTTNKDCDELYKWVAAAVWRNNWNIDADDFAGMLKASATESSNLIDNRFVQPSSGLIQLCLVNGGKYAEAVREQFRALLDCSGDIDDRQTRMESFMESVNAMIEEAYPGSWKYPQDMKTVSDYLGMIDPSADYFFKSTEARRFANYVEFGDEIGAGKSFSLKNYYRMCGQIVDGIRQREDLCNMVQNALREKALECGTPEVETVDAEFHILAFDIMYCTNAYGFYTAHPHVIPKRKYGKGSQAEIAAKRASYQEQIDKLEEEIMPVTGRLSELQYPNVVGTELTHITYGKGVVKEQDAETVILEFTDGKIRNMKLRTLVRNDLLTDAPADLVAVCTEIDELEKIIDHAGNTLKILRYYLKIS